jgi:hypothetical protein
MYFYVKHLLEGEEVMEFESLGTKNMFIVNSKLEALRQKWRGNGSLQKRQYYYT